MRVTTATAIILFMLSTIGVVSTEESRPYSYPALGDFSVPDHRLVERYRTQYTSDEGIKYLSAVMKRSVLYREFIRAEIQRLEVPEILFYLPVIESGFSATAVSRSGAVGVWQFMKNSIGGFGMRITEWMDERRDPWISTTAALRKLKDNYAVLGDWELALAAYNCGLGATRTAIRRGGKSDYWYLSDKGFFKPETVHYVPKFLAIAEILSKSDEYGIDWGTEAGVPKIASLTVDRPVDLGLLSRETGVPSDILKAANPSLYYNITPPDMKYELRLPEEYVSAVQTLLSDPQRMLLEFYMYRIKSGDTLYALSLHYGVSVDMILQYNPGVRANTLRIGKNLVIPALREVGAYAGKKDSDTLDFSGSYLVKQGDSLWSIALAYNIQVETLAERNNLEVNSILKLGKQLKVPIL